MFDELQQAQAIFDLPARKFFTGSAERDLSVPFHAQRAPTALGPAAGPHSQMAQNLVLSWLAGCRILELKTVQVRDDLVIPRPCIDMQTVGYNVEWSQELKLAESLDEYVKGAMLIRILQESGAVAMPDGQGEVFYDMSVGYDLAGIQSPGVRGFLAGMRDCSAVVERLRAEIPDELAQYRALDFPTRISDTLTLSTFHGCPPDEIERIIEHLQDEHGLHCVIKFNPTLLGAERVRGLMNDILGYREVNIPDSAFENDTTWEQAQDMVERLGARADERGLGFGVKFSNTLIVDNHRDFFPKSEQAMYLSGPPLHVLAIHLVEQFRARFGDRYPISFSAGIQRKNFPDAVALGLVPITVCSDLLGPGGYGRASGYLTELGARMKTCAAADVDEFILRAFDQAEMALDDALLALGREGDDAAREACLRAVRAGEPLRPSCDAELFARWVSAAKLRNTPIYARQTAADPRYASVRNNRPPRKIGSHLELFDCITCDKCVPVCPNDANFTYPLAAHEIAIVKATREDGAWKLRQDGVLSIREKHQIANFADFCNDCGNCDVFCPEDGGPYAIKPRFFGRLEDWRENASVDGFCYVRDQAGEETMYGRFEGREYRLSRSGEGGPSRYAGPGFVVLLDESAPADSLALADSGEGAEPEGEIDLVYASILADLRAAVYAPGAINYPRYMAE